MSRPENESDHTGIAVVIMHHIPISPSNRKNFIPNTLYHPNFVKEDFRKEGRFKQRPKIQVEVHWLYIRVKRFPSRGHHIQEAPEMRNFFSIQIPKLTMGKTAARGVSREENLRLKRGAGGKSCWALLATQRCWAFILSAVRSQGQVFSKEITSIHLH